MKREPHINLWTELTTRPAPTRADPLEENWRMAPVEGEREADLLAEAHAELRRRRMEEMEHQRRVQLLAEARQRRAGGLT